MLAGELKNYILLQVLLPLEPQILTLALAVSLIRKIIFQTRFQRTCDPVVY